MARRGGKAASRRARQQRRSRPATPAAAVPTSVAETAVEPTSTAAPVVAQVATAPRLPALGSALSAHAREEYHYVGRDLRNIGGLVLVMVLVLTAVTVAINVL